MKHIIHVHQQNIRKGLAAIIDRTYKGSKHSRALSILCPTCHTEAARVVQHNEPDRCGARVWIEATETAAAGEQR